MSAGLSLPPPSDCCSAREGVHAAGALCFTVSQCPNDWSPRWRCVAGVCPRSMVGGPGEKVASHRTLLAKRAGGQECQKTYYYSAHSSRSPTMPVCLPQSSGCRVLRGGCPLSKLYRCLLSLSGLGTVTQNGNKLLDAARSKLNHLRSPVAQPTRISRKQQRPAERRCCCADEGETPDPTTRILACHCRSAVVDS